MEKVETAQSDGAGSGGGGPRVGPGRVRAGSRRRGVGRAGADRLRAVDRCRAVGPRAGPGRRGPHAHAPGVVGVRDQGRPGVRQPRAHRRLGDLHAPGGPDGGVEGLTGGRIAAADLHLVGGGGRCSRDLPGQDGLVDGHADGGVLVVHRETGGRRAGGRAHDGLLRPRMWAVAAGGAAAFRSTRSPYWRVKRFIRMETGHRERLGRIRLPRAGGAVGPASRPRSARPSRGRPR